jgi:hypothetical protein
MGLTKALLELIKGPAKSPEEIQLRKERKAKLDKELDEIRWDAHAERLKAKAKEGKASGSGFLDKLGEFGDMANRASKGILQDVELNPGGGKDTEVFVKKKRKDDDPFDFGY